MRRPHRVRLVVAAVVAGALGSGAALDAASFPPRLRFETLEGARVSVHFHDGLETLARRTLPLAEELLAGLERRYGVRVPRVHVVVSDIDDAPNGSATPLPYPIVQIRAAAPSGTEGFGNVDSWLRLVLSHELTHVVHLEGARGVPGLVRHVLGRAPFLFPNVLTPPWMIEGLATYEETEATAFGRGRDPNARMVVRMAALEGRFPGQDQATTALDAWPGGQTPYLFGQAFLRDVAVRGGDWTLPELARVNSGHLVPFLDDLTAKRVTGTSFHGLWRDWQRRTADRARAFADAVAAQGLTASRPLTTRGIRQAAPRFSPDGSWIAYTSVSLERYRAIRVMRADGTDDHQVAVRNGGTAVSWTPDGRALVYDEPETYRRFEIRSDLRRVDLASGRVSRLTHGRRASAPDVSRQGGRIVFVRREGDRSELAVMAAAGGASWDLTRSAPGTEWSGPRWTPDGRSVIAARRRDGGWLDLVSVDADSGGIRELTHDRSVDAEPAVTRDGRHVLFRSDRDGVSNLYALRLEDGVVLRLTRVVGGAFAPDPGPAGEVAFASYGARGYDVHVLSADLDSLAPAPDVVEYAGSVRDAPPPSDVAARPYRPFPALLPRFWVPWLERRAGEWLVGAATGGADPLLRHAYGVEVHRGSQTHALGTRGFYQYDRWAPTLLVTFEDETRPAPDGETGDRAATLRASLPVARRQRHSHDVSLAYRRERATAPDAESLDLGGLELAYTYRGDRRFPFSISASEGATLRAAASWEDPAFGSDLSLAKLSVDVRAYRRVLGASDVLAVHAGLGWTFGEPDFAEAFSVGGYPAGSLLDLGETNLAELRGYPDDAFHGRRVAHAAAEYRFPLGRPQAGWRSLPVFVRSVHGSVFFDAANVWSDAFRLADTKTGAGAALSADLVIGHGLPIVVSVGLARGFDEGGETRLYLRVGY